MARAVTKRSTSPPGGMGARPELRSAPRRAIHRRLFLNAWWRRASAGPSSSRSTACRFAPGIRWARRCLTVSWIDGVAELVADIRELLALGDEEARERVPEVVEAHASELGLLEDLVEHAVAEVVSVEGAPSSVQNNQSGTRPQPCWSASAFRVPRSSRSVWIDTPESTAGGVGRRRRAPSNGSTPCGPGPGPCTGWTRCGSSSTPPSSSPGRHAETRRSWSRAPCRR